MIKIIILFIKHKRKRPTSDLQATYKRPTSDLQATYKMASLIVSGTVLVVVGVMFAKRKSPIQSYRDILRASAAKAYAYQQSLIIEAEMREEAMNKLSIYEQEVIKEIELELQLDNLDNLEIVAKMKADKAKIRAKKYKEMMENTPEYKEMLKKYKRRF